MKRQDGVFDQPAADGTLQWPEHLHESSAEAGTLVQKSVHKTQSQRCTAKDVLTTSCAAVMTVCRSL